MEERPETPSIVSPTLQACAPSGWRFSHPDLAPCDARQGRVPFRMFLGREAQLAHRFARTRACTRASAELPSRGPSPQDFTPPEAELLFRAHRRPCQRDDSLLRASSPYLRLILRFAAEHDQDAYDRFLLPTT